MTLRTSSRVRRAFLALPFQIRQCRRSTSGTITAFACIRPGVSVDNPLAACFACCSRMAMWNQSANRRFLATGFRENQPKAGGAVGERGQLGVGGSTDRLKAAPNHRRGLRVGVRHGAEHLSATAGCFDVADANLQMSLAIVAAADEGRVYGDGDRRHSSRRRLYG